MMVRKKITLLITTAGFISSLVFSCFILWEAIEEPFRLIDSELDTVAQRTAAIVSKMEIIDIAEDMFPNVSLVMGDKPYWLKVYNLDNDRLIYQSNLGGLINITEPAAGSSAIVNIIIPNDNINLRQDQGIKEIFRVKKTIISIDGKSFAVCIGRSIEELKEELWEVILDILIGLGFSIIVLLSISYLIAGLILKPIRIMNDQARFITEKNLDQKIPISGDPDEFNMLARTLNQVFERLQYAFVRQKQLLADTSHELKTPLTMIRLALEMTHPSHGETVPSLQGKALSQVTEQVLRMEKLVKNMLVLSSLEIGNSMKKERIDVGELIRSLIEDYQYWIDQSHIKISFRYLSPLISSGNFEKLSRAFSNLIDNAIKYNVKDGKIEVTGKQTENSIMIMIRNTGPGVAAVEIDKIFDQFYRVEQSRSLQHGGAGLGLAIVKRIIELHNGKVTFESKPGIWTRVIIDLPRY